MKALGLVVSEMFFPWHCKSMGANDPWGWAIFDPRGMTGRIYKLDHYTLLHTKYEGSGPCGFEEEDFFMFCPITPCGFGEEDFICFTHDPPPPPRAEPVWTPGARLAGFIKRTTINCYTQNMKGLGLVVSEKKIFYVFPIVSLWELSVAMETRVPIRPGPKPNATFPPPQ